MYAYILYKIHLVKLNISGQTNYIVTEFRQFKC